MERFLRITTADGLPENTGQAIIQDRDGFIWIGTQNGLARYDGREFKVYQHESGNATSLSNNQIQGLLLDKQNILWVVTRNGLNRFDPVKEEFEVFLPDSSEAFKHNWLSLTLVEDGEGNIWTSGSKGFYKIKDWDSKNIQHYPLSPGRNWTSLAYDHKNNMVYGAVSDSLIVFNEQGARFINKMQHGIVELGYSSYGLLCATGNGVFIMIDNNWVQPDWLKATSGILVMRVHEDKDGYLWVLSNVGLMRFDKSGLVQEWKHNAASNESLSHNLCLSIHEDNQGMFWVGTGQGINILDPRQDMFLRLSTNSGKKFLLPDPHVQSIHFSDSLNLWIGTAEGLLHLRFREAFVLSELAFNDWPIHSQTVYSIKNQALIESDNINVIYSDSEGMVWFGTDMGHLYRVDPESESIERIPQPNGNTQLRGLTERNGNMFVGFGSELFLFKKELKEFYRPDWLPSTNVVQFGWFQDELWVGSRSGIYIINPTSKSWRLVTAGNGPDDLPNTMITHTMARDKDLWICTFGGGLYCYKHDSARFTIYSEADGLPNNNLWAAYFDEDDKLWLSTDNGISKFDPETETFTNFDRSDGLNFEDFSMSAHEQNYRGEILFGNPQGLSIFHPRNIRSDSAVPAVVCTEIEVNYQTKPEVLTKIRAEKQGITLYPNDRTLSVKVAVLNFRNQYKSKYAFKLDGFNDQWVERNAFNNYISFTDLPPGKYSLQVKACNLEGQWSKDPMLIPVRVVPPFYQSWWFRISAMLILLIAILGLAYYYNRRRYIRHIQELETQQKIQSERERISRDLHDNVGAHLTKIITDLDLLSLKLENQPSEANQEQIENTRGFTQNTVRLLRDTIWAIDQDEFSLSELADKIERFLEQYLGDFVSWKVTRDISKERQLGPGVVMNILRIIQEATQNMLKHSGASFFEIVIKNKERLEIEMSDNGAGMGDVKAAEEHYGLKNMAYRAEEISGRLELNSMNQEGTIVLLSL